MGGGAAGAGQAVGGGVGVEGGSAGKAVGARVVNGVLTTSNSSLGSRVATGGAANSARGTAASGSPKSMGLPAGGSKTGGGPVGCSRGATEVK